MRNNKGFSLVELIVVIAIMAVLASVAVIGVSVYIPKAQEAADNELLNIMTDALTAACLSEGIDPADVRAEIAIQSDGSLKTENGKFVIALKTADGNDLAEKTNAALTDLFNQVVDATETFKLLNSGFAFFNGTSFSWKGTTGLALTYPFKGKEYIVDPTDRTALLGSIFADSNVMTPGDLVTNVDAVVDFAAGMVDTNSLLAGLVNEPSFQEIFAAMYPGLDINDPNNNEQKMSALVVYTAQNSQDLDNQDVYNAILAEKGGYGYILYVNSNDTQDVTTVAMHYALGLAWAKETGYEYNDDPSKLFDAMSDTKEVEDEKGNSKTEYSDFVKWMENPANRDKIMNAMNGYKGAMNIIGSNSNNITGDDLLDENGDYVGFGVYEDLIEKVIGQD